MEKQINEWIIQNTINNQIWKNFDDFHVEGTVNEWLIKGVELFRLANSYLRKNNLPFYVELNIILKYSKHPMKINLESRSNIEKQLSSTPPSLYIFPNDYEKLDEIKQRSILLDVSLFDEKNAFYNEIYDESEKEYFRKIYIVP